MSFGKLLASGKSFVRGHSMARYRVNRAVLLPKFISPKNPFAQLPNKDALVRTVSPETHAGNLPKQTAQADVRAALRSNIAKNAARASVWYTFWKWVGGCIPQLNLRSLLERRPQRSKLAVPRVDKEPLQGELSLERVQVVRNDLSDADLEVVCVGGNDGGRKSPQFEGAWGRLATRIFETETT